MTLSTTPCEIPVTIETERLTVSILPQVGAKILDLVDRATQQNFLWRNPRIAPQRYPIEANFDNYWCGGWDDGFPTCELCTHNGETYPNLGELRSVAWHIDGRSSSATESSIQLSAAGPISTVQARKTVRVTSESVIMRFDLENTGHLPIDYIWGTHPAYAITPDCVLHIPARKGIVGQANDPKLGVAGQVYPWPNLPAPAGDVNMARVLPPGPFSAGHYATELTAGWYAVEYPERGSGILLEFPLDLCPYLWLWLSYGGWRGYYLAVIEPWTSYPVTLSDAVAQRTHRVLAPGGAFSCQVSATPWARPVTLPDLLRQRGLSL